MPTKSLLSSKNLIWIDLEMTGLDTKKDHILEIATIITDKHLNILEEGPAIAIHQPSEILKSMNKWNTEHHAASGLTPRVKKSLISERKAEKMTLDFIKQFVPKNKSPMCGNSICQDRRFLARFMPKLESYFHYRQIDVSTLKELARRWHPHMAKQFKKKSKHLALDDIKDSINELKFYREHFLRLP